MSEFDRRLRSCAKRYRTDLQAASGGFGEDRFPDAPVSIVNTAEVLTVFHAARTSFQAQAVQRALKYIAEKVAVHPLPRDTHAEARGPSTRYAAFGLLGLTAYPEAVHARSLEEAQRTCVRWLEQHELTGGGWSESAKTPELSPLSTQAAVEGLERLCPRVTDIATEVQALCHRARGACLARGTVETGDTMIRWWPRGRGDEQPSASATALAVLLLAGGNAHQKGAARQGVNWLVREIQAWQTTAEGDAHSKTANWRHMTFSLGLRAVLTGSRISPRRPELQPSIAFLDALWNDEQEGWSHGTPGADVTPSGCQAVVLAVQALQAAYVFDPDDLLEPSMRRRRTTPPRKAARRTVILDANSRLTVIEPGDRVVIDRFPLKPRAADTTLKIVRLLMQRQIAHPNGPLDEVATTTAELVDAVAAQDAVLKAITRLNKKLADAASIDVGTLAELIQPVNGADNPADRRWRIDATEFAFVD